MDYDTWKTTAPEPVERSMWADVSDGCLTLSFEGDPNDYADDTRARIEIGECGCDDETPEGENARIVEEIRAAIRNEGVVEFSCSSSVDFPSEYGVRRPVDLRALLAQALREENS